MRKTKFLSLILAVTVLMSVFMPLSAGALSLEELSKAVQYGQTVEYHLTKVFDDNTYKFVVPTKELVTVHLESNADTTLYVVYNYKGVAEKVSSTAAEIGTFQSYNSSIYYNSKVQKAKGEIRYLLEPGTYYVQFAKGNHSEIGDTFKFSITSAASDNAGGSIPNTGSDKPAAAAVAPAAVAYITIPVKAGTTLQLYMLGTNVAGTTTWTSTVPSVATVTAQGTVTGVSAGLSYIMMNVSGVTQLVLVWVY